MIVGIIQARMGSTRLPGKVLKKINGVPLLKFQLDRVKAAKRLNKILIATTNKKEDDPVEQFCNDHKINCYRGSEDDVLSRYYESALSVKADVIVRLTADCPFVDPTLIDNVIDLYMKSEVDYASNTVPPESSCWPDGSDIEVFSFKALKMAHNQSVDKDEREHVTFFFWKNKENKFKTIQLGNEYDWSNYRFTVDYNEDFEAVKMINNELIDLGSYGYTHEIISILESNPRIKEINNKYYFGIGWEKN